MSSDSPIDWKKALPFIGALATGGVPALVTAAAGAIADAIGSPVEPTQDGIDAAMQAATPEQLAAIKQVEANLKIRMRELDVQEQQIKATTEAVYVDDVKNARQFNANTHGILYLGYGINALSYVCVFAILYGCFNVIMGSRLAVDPGLAAMVGSVVGAVVQWLMTNASQANSFFFGSSPGSRQVAQDLAKSVGEATSKIK